MYVMLYVCVHCIWLHAIKSTHIKKVIYSLKNELLLWKRF